ncbi:hypothetical protein QE380_002699 [Acinetobacter baylyi]|uniref:Phage protein n=1 Tax=Acinetobacter baylyi TaxID=202950 RepID=A0ABU0UYX7_ACIBI|nr:hypothetical protein [Acinetobacter baylyi]MDQ1209776.1 hypothetical protein [Acinetobacter baylyi]MDR6106626.1 hypothetical protein [Acinetobacter baylyi]MDR6186645.1 hypothetical protein [Acinetobacter baylyi]
MDIQTRLSLLDQHLSLLIESTENCDSLTGESVAATLFIIQEQVRLVQNAINKE